MFWIDLEMTGLNVDSDQILEVAVVITDLALNPLEEFHRVVYQPPSVLEGMNAWCKKTHGESGLTAAVATGKPLAAVEDELVALIQRHFSPKDKVVLTGNSVNNDKAFVDRYLPKVAALLHYRIIDVSSFKEIFRDRYSIEFQKKNLHRATDDIYESIRELSYYLSFVQVPASATSAANSAKKTEGSSP